jgi:hypothetical protein
VTGIAPDNLVLNKETEITITGTGLDTASVIKVWDVMIEDSKIIKKTDTPIKFNHTAKVAGSAVVVGLDDNETELFSKSIPVSKKLLTVFFISLARQVIPVCYPGETS